MYSAWPVTLHYRTSLDAARVALNMLQAKQAMHESLYKDSQQKILTAGQTTLTLASVANFLPLFLMSLFGQFYEQ